MEKRTTLQVVVTGGQRGIGRAVAEQLVEAGARVILVGRDEGSGRAAEREIRARVRGADVTFCPGDLSDNHGTRAVFEALQRLAPSIDVLVHNAGIWPSRLELNREGIERAFAVNHLAPFALNHLLRPAIREGGRIVQVSAGLYIKGRIDRGRTARGEDFSSLRTYATTKLANLLLLERFAAAFADRGVTVNAVHPGVIRTGLGDRGGPIGLLLRGVKRLWGTPEEGARPVVRVALDPALGGTTGRYFDRDRDIPLAPLACDRELAAWLWDEATRFTGLGGAADALSSTTSPGVGPSPGRPASSQTP
jgi:NAD(P)-dependent dehydrogenase (short-subunit alcohol dehydrogenase family)